MLFLRILMTTLLHMHHKFGGNVSQQGFWLLGETRFHLGPTISADCTESIGCSWACHNPPKPLKTTNKWSMWRKTAMNQYHWLDLQGSRLLLCWVFCLKCHASRKSSDSLPVYFHKQYQRKASKNKACWFGVESPPPFIPELMTLLTFLLALASLSRCSQQNCPFWLHSAHAFLIFATFSFSFSLCALGTLRFPPHVFATLKGFPTLMRWRFPRGDLGSPNHRQCLASENRPPGFPAKFPSLPWGFRVAGSVVVGSLALRSACPVGESPVKSRDGLKEKQPIDMEKTVPGSVRCIYLCFYWECQGQMIDNQTIKNLNEKSTRRTSRIQIRIIRTPPVDSTFPRDMSWDTQGTGDMGDIQTFGARCIPRLPNGLSVQKTAEMSQNHLVCFLACLARRKAWPLKHLDTPPKLIDPEKWGLEDYFPSENVKFQGLR